MDSAPRSPNGFLAALAADDFELIGEPARAALMDALSRFPSAQTWPELARVRALLG